MLFVRNRGGVSHSPEEHVEPEDVAAAGAALLMFLRERVLPGAGDASPRPACGADCARHCMSSSGLHALQVAPAPGFCHMRHVRR